MLPTVVGTSVEALALLTYFRLFQGQKVKVIYEVRHRYSRPCLTLLGHDLKAQNTVLSKVHVSLKFYKKNAERHRSESNLPQRGQLSLIPHAWFRL